MRLFVALPVPTAIEREIAALQSQLTALLPDLPFRPQRPDGAHLTLVFLGTVAERDLPYCRQALAAGVRHHTPFTLASAALGAFPSPSRPSVLWLGVISLQHDALAALQRDLAGRLSVLRRDSDPPAFRPHLTLGRLSDPAGDAGAVAGALAALTPQPHSWTANEVVLYRSRTTRAGAVYHALARETLGAGPDETIRDPSSRRG